MHALLIISLLVITPLNSTVSEPVQQEGNLYSTVLMRAAPGHLMELIELVKQRAEILENAGEDHPLILRHSQGDHWDLMVIQPISSMETYYDGAAILQRLLTAEQTQLSESLYESRLREFVAWREETFYTGTSKELFETVTAPPAGYFHVEMFIALAGRHEELYRQREMENDYLKLIDRPLNLIFRKTLGGPWDCFTLGLYRDLKHFSEGADIPADLENEAAVAAGFESASMIGPYMRTLIARHNDTIGGIIR